MLEMPESLRTEIWQEVIEQIEAYTRRSDDVPVAVAPDRSKLESELNSYDFSSPLSPRDAIQFAIRLLYDQVHTGHPRCFGMFDPRPTTMGIAAEMLVAAFNPQLAAWNMAPGSVETERFLIRWFGKEFGYQDPDGTFTSGGQEANHTALLTALARAFPEFQQFGLRSLHGQPVFYISSEGHHSFLKAAGSSGLGTASVREIPVDYKFRMDTSLLREAIEKDRRAGKLPFLVVATAGTTSSGAIDPTPEIARIAKEENLWLHVDAAWGGGVILVPELRALLDGIELSDSITFDPHKLLAVPKGAGLYLTRHKQILDRTFHVRTAYMPIGATGASEVVHPFSHSLQWTRRFAGLQVFLSLAVAGRDGYADALRHQIAMANLLKRKLEADGWTVMNEPDLAVVCFADKRLAATSLPAIAAYVVASGRAWISFTKIGDGIPVLRACVVNYKTQPSDLQILCEILNEARIKLGSKPVEKEKYPWHQTRAISD